MASQRCINGYLSSTTSSGSRVCHSDRQWSGAALVCDHCKTWGHNIQLSIPSLSSVIPVFVSLGTTNYVANNSQIAIDTIGDTAESALTCRTDLTTCCRGQDNPDGPKGLGEWKFPNGTNIIRNQEVAVSDTDLFYRRRGRSSLFLNRRGSVSGPTGYYCCVLPASIGKVTFCVELGEWLPPLSVSALSCPLFNPRSCRDQRVIVVRLSVCLFVCLFVMSESPHLAAMALRLQHG